MKGQAAERMIRAVRLFEVAVYFLSESLYTITFLADHRHTLVCWNSEFVDEIVWARTQHKAIRETFGPMECRLRAEQIPERSKVYGVIARWRELAAQMRHLAKRINGGVDLRGANVTVGDQANPRSSFGIGQYVPDAELLHHQWGVHHVDHHNVCLH